MTIKKPKKEKAYKLRPHYKDSWRQLEELNKKQLNKKKPIKKKEKPNEYKPTRLEEEDEKKLKEILGDTCDEEFIRVLNVHLANYDILKYQEKESLSFQELRDGLREGEKYLQDFMWWWTSQIDEESKQCIFRHHPEGLEGYRQLENHIHKFLKAIKDSWNKREKWFKLFTDDPKSPITPEQLSFYLWGKKEVPSNQTRTLETLARDYTKIKETRNVPNPKGGRKKEYAQRLLLNEVVLLCKQRNVPLVTTDKSKLFEVASLVLSKCGPKVKVTSAKLETAKENIKSIVFNQT